MSTDWNLQSLFDRSIERSCPVASSSAITVILPEGKDHKITPENPAYVDGLAIYDLSSCALYSYFPTIILNQQRVKASNFTIPSNIAMYWPSEHSFQYRKFLSVRPTSPLMNHQRSTATINTDHPAQRETNNPWYNANTRRFICLCYQQFSSGDIGGLFGDDACTHHAVDAYPESRNKLTNTEYDLWP